MKSKGTPQGTHEFVTLTHELGPDVCSVPNHVLKVENCVIGARPQLLTELS